MVDICYIIKSMEKVLIIKKLLKFWLPPVLWAGVIFTFSSFPTVQTSDFYLSDFLLKKSAHLVEYGILAILIYRALINYNLEKKRTILLTIIIAFLYGVTDEFHQSFVFGRTSTIRDIVIDTLGATIGTLWIKKYL